MLTEKLTDEVQPMIEEIYNDDFMQGLVNGTVDKNAVVHYLQADALYLKEFANLYSMLITKTDSISTAEYLLSQMESMLEGESGAHAVLANYVNGTYEDIIADGEWYPSADHYIKHMYYNAYSRSNPAFALSAMAPCPYIYKKIAEMATERNDFSESHPFKKWFDFYNTDVDDTVDVMFNIIDKETVSMNEADIVQIRKNFLESTEHEKRFFSMAANKEKWRMN